MPRSLAAATLLACAVTACGGNAPTAPTTAAALPSVAAAMTTPVGQPGPALGPSAPQRPIQGWCQATYAEPPVVAPPFLRHVSVGTCQLSHLGRASLRTEAELNLATGVQISVVTLTASNGDRLGIRSVGTGVPTGPTTVQFTGTASITGGTGRFENATGEMAVEGTADNPTGSASFSYAGWIAYDAFARSGR